MNSRRVKLYSIKKNIELLGYRREADQLKSELDRLNKRIEQVAELEAGYKQQLAMPEMSATEYMTIIDIFHRLSERRRLDQARYDMLETERSRLTGIVISKKREVEKLEDQAKTMAIQEREEKQEIADRMMPAPRPR
jgi:predicted ribonuclease YlaK